jgi:uncharacterized membrane protein YqjE
MAVDLNSTTEPSLSSLVAGIVKDAQTLIKQEMALARREFAEELNKTKQAIASLAIGVSVAALGALFLLLMIVRILHEEVGLKMWHSYGLVGGALAIIGGILFLFGRNRASDIHLVPQQTVETMRENVQWIKNQT